MSDDRAAKGTLFVVGTPIGNLEDITLRALRVLREVDLIAAEDTRVTAKLLARHGIETPMVSCREQNAARSVPQIVARLIAGTSAAIVSDAGTPAVSDPGEQLVRAALAAGIRVVPIPGPSALATAISVAAVPGDGVRFVGFLPRTRKEREARIAAIAEDPACIVLYEAPGRLGTTLSDLAARLPDRQGVVLRELTKLHEEIARGTLACLADRFVGEVRGEIAIVVAGNLEAPAPLDEAELRRLVAVQIRDGKSARDIARALAAALGVSRKLVYSLALGALANGVIPDERGPGDRPSRR